MASLMQLDSSIDDNLFGKVSLRQRKQPSIATMERWMLDSVAKATDGCRVEPDGVCAHGCKSWLLELGLI